MTDDVQVVTDSDEPDKPTDPLLVLYVDHLGNASLVIRDDIETDAAIEWLTTSIAHLRELRATPAADVPTLDGASGTLAP